MPRANRHYIPGYAWHITHRCHQKEFLLKFCQDRKRYLHWLCEARKRYGLSVLNYIVTSNHIHLLVVDNGKDVIPKSMQLVAGRTGQEYNQRKGRKGAFWEDRYHATIVQTNRHLMSCMTYIDLNMVRAGVVSHPLQWEESGYHEILRQPLRYGLIDRKALKEILGFADEESLKDAYPQIVSDAMHSVPQTRQPMWSESVAVGNEDFVTEAKKALSSRALGRKVSSGNDVYELREAFRPYKVNFELENDALRQGNMFFWDVNAEILNS